MDKKDLVEKLLINFEKKVKESKDSFESARQAAIAAPGAMQSKSDTTKSQMSRLADGLFSLHQQTQRCVLALKEMDTSKVCKAIEIGAVVKTEEDQNETYYFITPPDCLGQNIELEGQDVNAISVKSPIAQALLNKKVGDVVNVEVPAGLRVFRIIEIK